MALFGKPKVLCLSCGLRHAENAPCPMQQVPQPTQQPGQMQAPMQVYPQPTSPQQQMQEIKEAVAPRQYPSAPSVQAQTPSFPVQQAQTQGTQYAYVPQVTSGCILCGNPDVVYITDVNARPALPLCIVCRKKLARDFVNEFTGRVMKS